MLNKVPVVIICFLFVQLICPTCSKTLPATNKNQFTTALDNDGERINPTTSYYRHNIFGPNTYAFGFEVNDKVTGNIQFRDERRYANGTVEGSYGYVRPDGRVMVTHFLADQEHGYLSQTQNFAPGDEPKWQENWPAKKPNIFRENPMATTPSAVVYDDKEKLNITSVLLPVEPINKEHGIDLNPPQLEKELVNPAVLEVINGEAPLVSTANKQDNTVGFETVNKFIPAEFPIVPFQLPQEDNKMQINKGSEEASLSADKKSNENNSRQKYNNQKVNNSEKTIILPELETANKYVKSKENNAEKSLPTMALKANINNEANLNNLPEAKSISIDQNTGWYDKVIKQTRQEYLKNIE